MKKINYLFVLGAIIFSACSGQPLFDTDATESAEGTKQLTMSVTQHGTPDADGVYPDLALADGTKVFQNDLGVTITLEEASLSWGHIELISAGDDADCGQNEDLTLHVESTQDLMDDDLAEQTLFDDLVADAIYCQYQIEWEAATSASAELSHTTDTDTHTVHLSGHWTDGSDSGDFSVSIDDGVTVSNIFYALEDGEIVAHPLHFHEDSLSYVLGVRYDQLLDGLDFSESEAEQQAQVIENLEAAVRQNLN